MGTSSVRQAGDVSTSAEARELGARLQVLAARLVAQSMVPSEDAIELHRRATLLQRASFVLRSELPGEVVDLEEIDLRADGG